jgi:8-oxo-dGTP diphosphatase
MRNTSRVLIEKDGKVLFFHRHKKGEEFYVIPGGKHESGETPEQAAIREAKEETNFDVEIGELLWKISDDSKGETRQLCVFPVSSFKGEMKLGGPEVRRNSKENSYELVWIPKEHIKHLFIRPQGLMVKMKEKYA